MKAFLTHWQGDWEWVKDFTDDYEIWNRSDEDIPGSVPRENIGDADYDKLDWLVQNYDNLPETFLWTKSNLHKFITPEEFDKVKNNTGFTPLIRGDHKTYSDQQGPVCFYRDDWYWERNNSWYLNVVPAFGFNSFNEWADMLLLPKPYYIPFAPGGSYILTKERVHRYGRDTYAAMRDTLPYCVKPGEAQLCERSYGLLWS